jgi:hypothetical protein
MKWVCEGVKCRFGFMNGGIISVNFYFNKPQNTTLWQAKYFSRNLQSEIINPKSYKCVFIVP